MGSHPVGTTTAQETAEVEAEPLTELPDAPWGETTVALVFPYHLDWRSHALPDRPAPLSLTLPSGSADRVTLSEKDERGLGVPRRAWDPLGLNGADDVARGRPRMTVRDTAFQHWFSPTNYFHSDYLGGRVVAGAGHGAFETWIPGPDGEETLPRRLYDVYDDFVLDRAEDAATRLEVLALERHEFPPVEAETSGSRRGDRADSSSATVDPGCGFAVLHLKAIGFTSDELTRLSEFLLKPSFWKEGGDEAEVDRGLSVDFTRMLHGAGLHVQVSRGGYTDPCSKSGGGRWRWKDTSPRDCHPIRRDPYDPCDAVVDVSGWKVHEVREEHFEGADEDPRIVYRTGRFGGPAGWRPESPTSPGRLPKAYNRVVGLWCMADDGQERPDPYNLFHLEGSSHWDSVQKWTYQLAHGHRLSGTYTLPDDSPEEADQGCFHVMGCEMRATRTGVAVRMDPALGDSQARFREMKGAAKATGRRVGDFKVDSYVSEGVVRSVVHGRFVDLTMLVIRQRFLLSRHMEDVARLHEAAQVGEAHRHQPAGQVPTALDLESQFQWFINQRWFDEVPGRPEATRVLQELQAAWGLTGDLERLRTEQEGLFRVETFLRGQRQRDDQAELEARWRTEDDRRDQEAKDQAEARDAEWRRRNRSRALFEYLAAVFAPPSLIFGALAVLFDPSLPAFLWGLGVSLAVIIAAVVILRRRSNRHEVDQGEEDVAPPLPYRRAGVPRLGSDNAPGASVPRD